MLPGILGSRLTTPDDENFPDILWFNAGRIALLRQFGYMALAANGRDPHPEYGQRCEPLDSMPTYYGALLETLRNSLEPHDYRVMDFAYDFRLHIPREGHRLAEAIRANATPAEPCAIVAHSQGGLVARWAWGELVDQNQQNLVRRMVTLGTPHKGSYAPCSVFSMDDPIITQILYYSNQIQGAGLNPWWFPWESGCRPIDITRVAATWISMYQLMPLVNAESAIYDPRRAELFNIENWPPNRDLSEAHLLMAAGDWQAWLDSPNSMPPPDVLTVVGGVGYSTRWALRPDGRIGMANAFEATQSGDGRVAVNSAVPLPSVNLVVVSEHSALTRHPTVLSRIGEMILRETPPPPSPGQNYEAQPQGLPMAGPPVDQAVLGQGEFRNCRDGTCVC